MFLKHEVNYKALSSIICLKIQRSACRVATLKPLMYAYLGQGRGERSEGSEVQQRF
jgi:hypothetical protein